MKKFSDFGIKTDQQPFTGEKIKIKKIMNREIVVHDYRVVPSKYPENGNGKCLHLSIELDEKKHIVFSGSSTLMNLLDNISKNDFPFETTIVEEDERFEFT